MQKTGETLWIEYKCCNVSEEGSSSLDYSLSLDFLFNLVKHERCSYYTKRQRKCSNQGMLLKYMDKPTIPLDHYGILVLLNEMSLPVNAIGIRPKACYNRDHEVRSLIIPETSSVPISV